MPTRSTAPPNRVAAAHRRAGYLSVRVVAHPTDPPPGPVAVELRVDPGPRVLVSALLIEVDGGLDDDDARTLVADFVAIGHAYDPTAPRAAAARLRAHLAARGYLDARVDAEATVADGSATVHLRCRAGTQHVLGDIIVSGTARTRDSFITGRFDDLEPGQPLARPGIDAGVRELDRSGLFRHVRWTAEPRPDGATDLHVAVAETDARSLDLNAGWGSWDQLRGRVNVADSNLFGHGIRGSVGAFGSMHGWGVDAGLIDRHHLGSGRTLALDTRFEERSRPAYLRRETAALIALRDEFRIGWDPDARWDWRATYDISGNQDLRADGAIADAEQPWYLLSIIGLAARRDSRARNPVDPEAGTLMQLGIRWSATELGTEIPYVEHSGRWTHHRRLGDDLTGVLNCAGMVRDPTEDDTLPIGERLFLGGEDTVRAYEQDQLGPHDANGDPTGGLTRAYGNAELRWRPFAPAPNLELSGFVDVGSLGQDPWSLDSPPGWGIGGGLRYVLPVGPIRVDGAYAPGERFQGDHPWAIHVSAGFAF